MKKNFRNITLSDRNKSLLDILFWGTVWFLLYASLFVGLSSMAGCTGTVYRKQDAAMHTSFDAAAPAGKEWKSGLVAVLPNGWHVVTPHFRDRYNDMIKDYRKRLPDNVEKDFGIRKHEGEYGPGLYEMAPNAAQWMATMNSWRRNGK